MNLISWHDLAVCRFQVVCSEMPFPTSSLRRFLAGLYIQYRVSARVSNAVLDSGRHSLGKYVELGNEETGCS